MRVVVLLAVALLVATPVVAQIKVKDKGSRSIVADKSKPVRKGIEDWYAQNTAAFRARDLKAVMTLRTADFHTLTPDGRTNDFKFMEERTRTFLDRIVEWVSLKFEIGTIEVDGDLAWAYITQDTTRMQRLADGTVHKVQARAIQRETFRRTSDGWRLYKVDDIKDLGTWIDGVKID
ncbi:MAG: nuclear transport factor 2 family protein [Trueperaceae bacterium]